MNLKFKKLYSFLILFFLITILWHNIVALKNNCIHATDFSIYQQAIYDISFLGNFNPYLTIRNLHIFNDHFDPVLLLSIPFVRLFSYQASSLLVFEWSWLVLFIGLLWREKVKEDKDHLVFLFLALIALLNKGIWSSFLYPIHPSTWSIIPIFLCAKFLAQQKFKSFLASLFFLFLFKEVFCVAALGFGFYFLFRKEYLKSLLTFLICLLWIILVFKLRPLILGPIFSYAGPILKQILHGDLSFLLDIDFIAFFKLTLPFWATLFILNKKQKISITPSHQAILFLWFPLLFLHLLTNRFHFQYGAYLCAPIISYLAFHPKINDIKSSTKEFLFILTVFALTSMGSITKASRLAFLGKSKKCDISSTQRSYTEQLKILLQKKSSSKTLLATGGVIPDILRPNMKIYQAGIFSKKQPQYDLIILEKNGKGDTYPYSKEEILSDINFLKQTGHPILMDNERYFVQEGPVKLEEDLYLSKRWLNLK